MRRPESTQRRPWQVKHGCSHLPLYPLWAAMVARCAGRPTNAFSQVEPATFPASLARRTS